MSRNQNNIRTIKVFGTQVSHDISVVTHSLEISIKRNSYLEFFYNEVTLINRTSPVPKLTNHFFITSYVVSVTGENWTMNGFSVSRPGGLRAGPKLSCSTILKSLKLDTDQPRRGRGGLSKRKSFSHYKLYNQRVRAGAGSSLWEPPRLNTAIRMLSGSSIIILYFAITYILRTKYSI